MTNPFKPSAGVVAAGADRPRAPTSTASGRRSPTVPGAPGRVSLFTGARGIGKTVMLNEVEDLYLAEGWLRISLTATSSLLAQLHRRSRDCSIPSRPDRADGSPASPPRAGSASTGRTPPTPTGDDLRRTVVALLDALGPAPRTAGHDRRGPRRGAHRLREVAALSQHLVREDRQFALAMAGLPSAVSNLLSDHVLTFLRRADRHDLCAHCWSTTSRTRSGTRSRATAAGSTPRRAPRRPPRPPRATRSWSSSSATRCGAPRRPTSITVDAVSRGVAVASSGCGSWSTRRALNDLSDVDREYLVAMAMDDGPSRVADVAHAARQERAVRQHLPGPARWPPG